MKLFISLLFALILFSGCKENNQPDCICTQVFVMITVEITDSLNRPLTNLQTRTIDIYGNTIITLYNKLDYQLNSYVIADDSNVYMFNTNPTQVIFIVTDSLKSKTYPFVLNTDECKCHINKLDGPQKIIF